MKTLLIVLGMALIVGVGFLYYPSTEVSVVKEVEVIQIKEDDKYGNLDQLIKEAQASSSEVIKVKLSNYEEELLKEIEDDVKADYIEKYRRHHIIRRLLKGEGSGG